MYRIARFAIRPDAREAAERAMHALASHVRTQSRDHVLSIYGADTAYYAVARGDVSFETLHPFIDGEIEISDLHLVTSTDLAPRRRTPPRPARRR